MKDRIRNNPALVGSVIAALLVVLVDYGVPVASSVENLINVVIILLTGVGVYSQAYGPVNVEENYVLSNK